ncbi:MAG: gliding motility-associated C-terminal domain-containing protein [Saprospiraceae bacterium]|nr:gliding motility-associated C-terminal domain-containing protein [Saprospiraceae bacterium]
MGFRSTYKCIVLQVLLLLVSCCSVHGQIVSGEVCDNALDDDNDGLIDLNDPDCACTVFEPKSLIPNPSFEEMSCCPQGRSQLQCAETWIQASAATTDYLHTCQWTGWPNLPPPMPFPDGDAVVGFRNGRFSMEESNANWKEYVGACLTEPLLAGNTYRFEFYLGFTNRENSPPIDVAFFGSENCDNLPFGNGDGLHGCPLNGPGWVQLDEIFALGENNWTKQKFEVTPVNDIYAIAIGPDCRQLTQGPNPYYFLDNLVLADIREFEFVIQPDSNLCADDFALRLPASNSLNYQWYRDGIALPNETNATLTNVEDGKYQVVITSSQGCRQTRPYLHNQPEFTDEKLIPLCPDAIVSFQGDPIEVPGIYKDTLRTAAGCDSIVVAEIYEASNVTSEQTLRIFPGETLTIGDQSFSEPVQTQVTIPSAAGCDSSILVDLQYYQVFIPSGFSPNQDGINDVFQIQGNRQLVSINQLSIFDRWGSLVHEQTFSDGGELLWDGIVGGKVAAPGPYIYIVEVTMDDGEERQLSGTVDLIR